LKFNIEKEVSLLNQSLKIVITDDGSPTVYSSEFDEIYHSTRGALQEARHVYIEHGLKLLESSSVRVLEMGLGTGLNAALTAQFAIENKHSIRYVGIEKYPLLFDFSSEVTQLYDGYDWQKWMTKINEAEWDVEIEINDFFGIQKVEADFLTWDTIEKFDVIYFDAFAPEKQAMLWQEDVFTKCFSLLNSGGVLSTYCSKSIVQKQLKSVGFEVEKYPGPPGKREILVARKNS